MEFLGDAVLSSVIADFLFQRYPIKDEGFLTEMRSKIVNRSNLNQLSKKIGLDKMIHSEQENGSVYKSISGDAFEAIIGAVYIDRGYKFVKKVIINRIISCYIDIEALEKKESNYKSTLIEFAQKEKKQVDFKVIEKIGQGYHKQYVVAVYYDNNQIAVGYGYSIKEAEQNGAANACNEIPEISQPNS
jgi:ribonuclease III